MLDFPEQSGTPSPPSSGRWKLYAKSGGWYAIDDAGVEIALGIRLGTAQASTSGTSIDFTGIPASTKRITINFAGVGTSGTSNPLIQLGDSGVVKTSGYLGVGVAIGASITAANYTAGFGVPSSNAANVIHGSITLELVDSATNTWAAAGVLGLSSSAFSFTVAGTKVLSAELDRVRLTTAGAPTHSPQER